MNIPKEATPYNLLQNLERNIRALIRSELSELTKQWWKQRIPEDIKINAKKRKQQNEKLPASKKHSLLHYVDFTDYEKIIIKNDNWNAAFKEIFGTKESIAGKLQELQPIRNAISHSRDLAPHEIRRLKFYSEEIISIIKVHNRRKIKKKKPRLKPWLKFKPHPLVISTSFDRTVYPLESYLHIRVNAPIVIPDTLIGIEIYSSKKELITKSVIDPETFDNLELKSAGFYETTIKMTGNKWKIGEEYHVIVKHGQAENFDSCRIDKRIPIIQTDKSVYILGSDIILTIIDPDADKDNQMVEFVGDRKDSKLIIESSKGKIENYRLRETGESTGIFQGLVGLIPVFSDGSTHGYDLDGKIITKTQGSEVEDGFLEVTKDDQITFTYTNSTKTVKETVYVSNFGATVELDKKTYSLGDKIHITVVAPDYSFDSTKPNIIGDSKNSEIIISTNIGKLQRYKLVETGNHTGIFTGEITLSDEKTKSQGNGSNDGILPSLKKDRVKVSFNYFDDIIIGSALIK